MLSQAATIASESRAFAGFLWGLPAFLRQRMTYDEALAAVQERLRNREANFLTSMERGVFGNPRSPYRAMLALADCELGDLQHSVREKGLEDTLRALRQAGVYVSFEEFKGLTPIVRSGQVIETDPTDFDNPTFRRYYQLSTGGSTGKGRRVLMDLTSMAARMPMRLVSHHCDGGPRIPEIRWTDIPPSHGLNGALMAAACGDAPATWYTAVWGGADLSSRRFRWATHAALATARLSGARVVWPEYLPLERASVIAEHARELLRTHGACRIRGSVSRMLRVAVAAREEGIDLTGATFHGGGEPPTPAKVAQITATGAKFRSGYHFTEAGAIGHCCATSEDPNDQHFMRDHLAMIQVPRQVPGFEVEVQAFCFTTLLSTATKLLLNVESDDYGVVETRPCGCAWGALGFTDHITEIRSYRKLTGEGITLIGSTMEKILWETLPERHGGSALDYQLLEEEDEQGFTRLTLLVNPSVALSEESAAVDTVLQALKEMGAKVGHSHAILRQAGTLRMRREAPHWTSRGKLMPLELTRRTSRADRKIDR